MSSHRGEAPTRPPSSTFSRDPPAFSRQQRLATACLTSRASVLPRGRVAPPLSLPHLSTPFAAENQLASSSSSPSSSPLSLLHLRRQARVGLPIDERLRLRPCRAPPHPRAACFNPPATLCACFRARRSHGRGGRHTHLWRRAEGLPASHLLPEDGPPEMDLRAHARRGTKGKIEEKETRGGDSTVARMACGWRRGAVSRPLLTFGAGWVQAGQCLGRPRHRLARGHPAVLPRAVRHREGVQRKARWPRQQVL